jgi:hypothetical protein
MHGIEKYNYPDIVNKELANIAYIINLKYDDPFNPARVIIVG